MGYLGVVGVRGIFCTNMGSHVWKEISIEENFDEWLYSTAHGDLEKSIALLHPELRPWLGES